MLYVEGRICFSILLICFVEVAYLDQGSSDSINQCKDTLTNCNAFSDEACDDIFKSWAIENCPERCGYCQDFSICKDVYDCKALPGEICSAPNFKKFALQFCRKHCKLCSTVANICSLGIHDCDEHATCTDTRNGYECTCNRGYRGNGKHCEINDECALGLHDCDVHATCTDTAYGYTCTCKKGYKGSGKICDPDECALGLHDCNINALCSDSTPGFTCTCNSGFTGNGHLCDPIPREDCQDVLKYSPSSRSGIYTIKPFGDVKPFPVYCEMETAGGGWTVFQRRFDGSVDFHRNWTDYKNGFGNASGEYWLGNEILHRMTTKYSCTLRIDIWDKDNATAFNTYSTFYIDNEERYYTLHVSGASGNAGGFGSHNGLKFSASDRDNDRCRLFCSNYYMGGWWYSCCYYSSNLNGPYRTPGSTSFGNNATISGWSGLRSLKATRMMIRHSNSSS